MPPRGEPLHPGRWYTQPVAIPPKTNGAASYQARQGDIFRHVPSVWLDTRPVFGVRNRQPRPDGRVQIFIHPEDGPQPQQPWNWEAGEDVVSRALKGWGVLLSQDCELEKPHPMIAFAYVRLVDGSQGETAVELIRNRRKYRSFYLASQQADPEFPEAYVDFGRVTTMRLEAIRLADRYASMTDEVRDAMREDFIEFMSLDRAEND